MDFNVSYRITLGRGQLAIIYSDSAEEIRFSSCPGVQFLTCHVNATTSLHRSENTASSTYSQPLSVSPLLYTALML